MIRPACDTPVLSKWGGFSLLFRAQNCSNCNILVKSLIRKNPHNQAGYADRLYGRGRRARTLGTRFWRHCRVRVSQNFCWHGVAVIERFRKTHAKPPMILWWYPISLMLWAVFFLPVTVSKTDAAICICGCIKQRLGKTESPSDSKRRNDDTVFLSRYIRYFTIH